MSYRIRAARPDDLRAFYDLAKLTGGGFTNLPAERATLEDKLTRSEAGFSRQGENQSDDLYVFMLENFETGAIRGTGQVFGAVGTDVPFYSYLISTLTQKSQELGRIFRNLTQRIAGSTWLVAVASVSEPLHRFAGNPTLNDSSQTSHRMSIPFHEANRLVMIPAMVDVATVKRVPLGQAHVCCHARPM